MKSIDQIMGIIKTELSNLIQQVKILNPTAIGNIGSLGKHAGITAYASFLRTVSSDTIDLCVYLKTTEEILIISADVVKGGQGEILSEIESKALLSGENEIETLLDEIRNYIISQKQLIISEMDKQAVLNE